MTRQTLTERAIDTPLEFDGVVGSSRSRSSRIKAVCGRR